MEIGLHRVVETIEISLADDGPGVAEAESPLSFNRFRRCNKSRTRLTGGIGLKLTIAR